MNEKTHDSDEAEASRPELPENGGDDPGARPAANRGSTRRTVRRCRLPNRSLS